HPAVEAGSNEREPARGNDGTADRRHADVHMNVRRVAQGDLPLDGAVLHVDRREHAPWRLYAGDAEAGLECRTAHSVGRPLLTRKFKVLVVTRLALLEKFGAWNERNHERQVH